METYFTPLYKGEDSFYYMAERSLMRQRNMIKMMIHAKGSAVNKRHDRILHADIEVGLSIYSNDVLREADEELSDIEPAARDLLY